MTNTPVDYNIKDTEVIVGTKSINDFTSEITVVKNEDDVTISSDLAGNVVYNATNNQVHTITLPVNPTSSDNAYLRGLRASGNQFPVFIKNKTTGETTAFTGCKFQKSADKNYGAEIGERSFSIYGAKVLEIE